MSTALARPAGCPLEAPAIRPLPCPPSLLLTLGVAGTTRRRRDGPRGSPAGCGCHKTAGSGATGQVSYAPESGLRRDRTPRLVGGGRGERQGALALAVLSRHAGLCPWPYLPWRRPRSPHSCPGPEAHGSGWATSRRPRKLWAVLPRGAALSAKQESLCLPPAPNPAHPSGPVGFGRATEGLLCFVLEYPAAEGFQQAPCGEEPSTISRLPHVRWG